MASDHYYTASPQTEHDMNQISYTCRNVTLRFLTDAGVFSKKGIDYGTRTLLDSMQVYANTNILDLGCGYGPLGCFASKFAELSSVTMVDVNERAVALARKNVALNHLSQVNVLQSDGFEQLQGQQFDTILSNPPIRAGKQVIYKLFEQAFHALAANGQLWIVIQKKQGAPSALAKLESLFSQVDRHTRDKGYWILCAKK